MLASKVSLNIKTALKTGFSSRNVGILAPCLQKASDPIQQLFIDKIREYNQKSNNGKNLVEPTPELQKEMKSELEKIARQYGGGQGVDMAKFPTFKFEDPVLDPINLEK